MENDILDAFKDIGYDKITAEKFNIAVDEGPKSIEYTKIVEWLSKELKFLCSLDEHVHAITTPDDSSAFLLEVSSFLKELGCQYSSLMEGNVNQRLQSRNDRLLLLDFLISELQAARMIRVNKPDSKGSMEVTLQESSTAADLKNMLIALKFPKPPPNITPEMLFGKVVNKVKEVIAKAPPELVGKPLFTGVLNDKQWHTIQEIVSEIHSDYRMRRELLLKRLDVTIQSFQWSDRLKNQSDRILQVFNSKRTALTLEPNVDLALLLAARDDLAIIEKTSNASVRKNAQSSTYKVLIGSVPDRGGRPSEQQPPPPEMPSWQQRPGGGGGGGRGGFGGGGRGGGGGGGGDRGGRVQGGWNQGGGGGGGYQGGSSGGGYQGGGGGYGGGGGGHGGGGGGYGGGGGEYGGGGRGYHGGGGGSGGYQGGGGYHGGGGGYQGGGGGYQGGGGGRGYQGDHGGYQGGRGGYQGGGRGGGGSRGDYYDRGGGRGGRRNY